MVSTQGLAASKRVTGQMPLTTPGRWSGGPQITNPAAKAAKRSFRGTLDGARPLDGVWLVIHLRFVYDGGPIGESLL